MTVTLEAGGAAPYPWRGASPGLERGSLPEVSGGEAASFLVFHPARAAGARGSSRGVLGLLVVPGLSLGRGPAAEPVHQPGGVVPVHPGAGDLLQVSEGPDRAGAER